jgi:phosphate transport system permease protein
VSSTLLERPAEGAGTDGAATSPAPTPSPTAPLRRTRGPRSEDVGLLVGSLASSGALTWLLFTQLTLLNGPFGFVVVWLALFLLSYWVVNLLVVGRLRATDRVVAALVSAGAVTVAVPLFLMLGFIVAKGWHVLSVHLFTQDLRDVGPESPAGKGGLAQAIIGTLEQVALAAAIGLPAGVMTAVFLNEVGGRFSSSVRTVVTAMSGVPTVVAGVFIYSMWVVTLGQGFSGFAGTLALAILLLPSVTRTTEEVLRVVPDGLREASRAMGAPEWRTVWSVVLPTARSGIATALVLGVARAVGETAPLLFTIFGNNLINANPFNGPQSSLPLFIFSNVKSSNQALINLAFGAALVLVNVVLVLFVVARIVGRPRRSGKPTLRSRIWAAWPSRRGDMWDQLQEGPGS